MTSRLPDIPKLPSSHAEEQLKLRREMLIYSPSNPYFLDWVAIKHNDLLNEMRTFEWNSRQDTGTLAYKYLQLEGLMAQTSQIPVEKTESGLFIKLFAEYWDDIRQ